MQRLLAVALLLATTGCIDVPAMNGLMDRLVPEPEVVYREVELDRFEGQFAPDPDQDENAVLDAAQNILDAAPIASSIFPSPSRSPAASPYGSISASVGL